MSAPNDPYWAQCSQGSSQSGQGSGQGQASPDGEGMDEFAFQITQEEFLDFLFDDLELPNLARKKLSSGA